MLSDRRAHRADPPGRRRGARPRRPRTAAGGRVHHRDHGQRPRRRSSSSAPAGSSSVDGGFACDEQLMQTIERIVSTVNRRVDESNPMVDARLPTGERVNVDHPAAVADRPDPHHPPLPARRSRFASCIELGSLDERRLTAAARPASRAKLNVIVSGGTGSGKTTLLNALSGLIPDHERIITIEDSAELQLQQAHVVRAGVPPAQRRGQGPDHHPRPGPQLAAHAPRPHRRRRGPRRRDPRHAPGDVHRPRRLAGHRARQLAPRTRSCGCRPSPR